MKKLFTLFIFLKCSVVFATTQVYPTRVIFDDKERATTISVRNRGAVEESYTIKAVFFRMGANGSLEMIDNPTKEERSLVEYIRFSPRRITLKPNEEQVIRLMLKNTAALPPGDYRAHLRILPNDTLPAASLTNEQKVEMQLQAKIAVSISTFYYKGDVKILGELSQFNISKDPVAPNNLKFKVKLGNTGSTFLIGSFKLFYLEKDKPEKQIGFINGIFSYIPERTIEYSFEPTEQIDLTKGRVVLKFYGPSFLNEPLISTVSN